MDARTFSSQPGHEPHNQAHIYAEDGAGRDIGLTYDDHEGKTAAELVRRWNAFPDLLTALVSILPYAEAHEDAEPHGSDCKSNELEAAINAARAAITKSTH